MNKQELIDSIALKTGESKTVVAQIVDTMVDTITETLVDGDPVVLIQVYVKSAWVVILKLALRCIFQKHWCQDLRQVKN